MAERSYDYTEIKTRIIIRNDNAENWEGSTIVLEKGEPAIEYDAVNKTAKIKFGDGESTFSQLPFSTLTPSEVSSLISAVESGESSKVTTVITSGDGNAVTSGSINDDGTTLTLTKSESFVPVTGGTFTGDVTVSGDFTADNIKTTRNINITSTHKEGNDGDHDVYNRASINFINNGISINETPVKIESVYDVITEAEQKVRSSLDLTADFVSINDSISIGNDLIEVYEPIILLDNHFDYPSNIVTKKYVDDSVSGIVSAVDAMKFKGTIGTSGTVADIASISSPSTGDTYKIITATSLTSEQSFDGASHDLTVGDLVVYASNKWVFVPSGNEDVTTVKVAGSGDTINVSTTAQTGAVVLGTAAGVNTASIVTDSATTVPTSNAVKTYVDTLENSLGTAATTDATDYATAAQGTKADNAMPKSGGTFTGDVTVSGDLTADSIKTSGEITITPTTNITLDGSYNQEHDTSKITFVNTNKVGTNEDISIEAKYYAGYAGSHVYDKQELKVNATNTIFNYITADSINGVKMNCDDYDQGSLWYEKSTISTDISPYGGQALISVEIGRDNNSGITGYSRVNLSADRVDLNGYVTLAYAPTSDMNAATKKYVDDSVSGVTDTKVATVTTTGDGNAVTTGSISADGTTLTLTKGTSFIPTTGGTFTGAITLAGAPTADLQAATKKYVDDSVSSISTDSLIDGENILILNGGSATE